MLNGSGWPIARAWRPRCWSPGRWRTRSGRARPGCRGSSWSSGHQLAGVELAGHAAVEDRQRLGADVLAQLEELEEAQAERLEVIRRGPVLELVVPAVDDQLAFCDRADGVLPLVTRVRGRCPRRCSRRGSAGSRASGRRASAPCRPAGRPAGSSRSSAGRARPCRGRSCPGPSSRSRSAAPSDRCRSGASVSSTCFQLGGTAFEPAARQRRAVGANEFDRHTAASRPRRRGSAGEIVRLALRARPCRESPRSTRRTAPCPRCADAQVMRVRAALAGSSARHRSASPVAMVGLILIQPIIGSGNSNERFFTSSA